MRSLYIPRTVRMAILTAVLVVSTTILLCVSMAVLMSDIASASASPQRGASVAHTTADDDSPYGRSCAGHVVVYEDDPCWNWATMGNRRRGVVTRWGNPIVVGPCAYARLYRAHRLDSHNERMRGDYWAIHNGCSVAPHS